MGKKKKQHGRESRDVGLDKPDYAMDVIVERKKETKPVDKEKQMLVKDRLGSGAFAALEALRAKIDEEAVASPVPKKAARSTTRPTVSPEEARDSDLSFAELFDPTPPDEDTFDEMLEKSKQDWREYK